MFIAVAYFTSFFLSVTPPDIRYLALESPNSELTGSVLDGATGAPIDYANILLLHTPTGAMSYDGGHYLITGIKPGIYRVNVIMIGYASEFRDVYIPGMSKVVLDFRLSLAPPVIPDAKSLPRTYDAGTR